MGEKREESEKCEKLGKNDEKSIFRVGSPNFGLSGGWGPHLDLSLRYGSSRVVIIERFYCNFYQFKPVFL